MRLHPQVPSPQDAVRHFQDMAHGRLPKRTVKRRKLFGGWGGNGPSMLKTTLVSPTAMAVEQAKSQIKRQGQSIPRPRKKTIVLRRGKAKKSTPSANRKSKTTVKKKKSPPKKSPVIKKKSQPKKTPVTKKKSPTKKRKILKSDAYSKGGHSPAGRQRVKTYQDNFA